MRSKRLISLITLIIATTVLFTGCGSFHEKEVETEVETAGYERFQDNYFDVFDTVITVLAYCENQESFDELSKAIHEELKYYNRLFDIYSTYDGVNNARTINKKAGKEAVKVDPAMIDLLELSKKLYEETGGRMNIAMGAVLSIWHEAREESMASPEKAYIPDIENLREAEAHCDIDKIIIDHEASTVFLEDPEMSIDLGAIAKGYATEQVVKKMEELGYSNFIISAGGNVRASGTKGDGTPWVVAVQNPDTESDVAYVDKINLVDNSMVTSGVYQRYFEYEGMRYHHIIDPETLMPEQRFLSLSIMTKDSGLADALSTAVFNMEYEAGSEFIESMDGVEAFWVMADGSIRKSSGWESIVEN